MEEKHYRKRPDKYKYKDERNALRQSLKRTNELLWWIALLLLAITMVAIASFIGGVAYFLL